VKTVYKSVVENEVKQAMLSNRRAHLSCKRKLNLRCNNQSARIYATGVWLCMSLAFVL
jgi:hypothetical protein